MENEIKAILIWEFVAVPLSRQKCNVLIKKIANPLLENEKLVRGNQLPGELQESTDADSRASGEN